MSSTCDETVLVAADAAFFSERAGNSNEQGRIRTFPLAAEKVIKYIAGTFTKIGGA